MQIAKARLVWFFMAVAFLVLVGWCLAYIEVQPDGVYRNDKLGSEGLAFYEIANGKVRLIVLSEDRTQVSLEKNVGALSKRDGQWVVVDAAGDSTRVVASVFCLKVYHEKWASPETYPRMLKGVNVTSKH
jgi:hypothetical protein